MWEFSGDINYSCCNCGHQDCVSVEDFVIESIGSSERSMGVETTYSISMGLECNNCERDLEFMFEAVEYPVASLAFVLDRTVGADCSDKPCMEYLEEIYSAEDIEEVVPAIPELIRSIKTNPNLLNDIHHRQFEEIVAEIFSKQGFDVSLTQRTRDGGKDIMAVKRLSLGGDLKFYIECKYYNLERKVGVDIIRSVYGVHNEKDGPNKSFVVTSSEFSNDAKKFVEHKAVSRCHLDLIDRTELLSWISQYDNFSSSE